MTSSWAMDNVTKPPTSVVPEHCVILGMNTTIPWNNPDDLISLEVENVFDRIKSAILIPAICLIGLPANCINTAVFFKQGLRERINLCLFSLALVDLIYLTVIFVIYAERIYTQFTDGERIGVVYRYMVDHNVVGLYGFGYGTMFLTAVISVERCICVLFPLKAQTCMATKHIAFLIAIVVLLLAFTRFAVTAMYQITCFYEIRTQRMFWQLHINDYYFRHRTMISALNGVFYGFCLAVGCPVVVLIATSITALKLIHTVRWRSHTSSSLSSKEIGVTKMLIALSIEFFLLSIPIISLRVSPVFEPRLTAGGDLANTFNLLLGLSELFFYMSSSVNLFVYYFTGTRFRETLRSIVRRNGKTRIK